MQLMKIIALGNAGSHLGNKGETRKLGLKSFYHTYHLMEANTSTICVSKIILYQSETRYLQFKRPSYADMKNIGITLLMKYYPQMFKQS